MAAMPGVFCIGEMPGIPGMPGMFGSAGMFGSEGKPG
jgi:hypothetical protein